MCATDRPTRGLAPLLGLALAACAEPADTPPPAAEPAGQAAAAVCLQGDAWTADGTMTVAAGAADADADRVDALRWEAHEGCERFVIDLADADGEPASGAGEVQAELLRGLGVVRVSLRDVGRVEPDATDTSPGGALAGDAYAMWSADGRWIDVDLHLADAAEAQVTVLEAPARVVIDVRPGGGAVPEPAPRAQRVVVLHPRPGEASYPLRVTGYARTFEANVVARLEQDGETAADTFTTATAWADAWGHFSLEFADGPSGSVRLHVGEHSARDGTWEGVEVALEMR